MRQQTIGPRKEKSLDNKARLINFLNKLIMLMMNSQVKKKLLRNLLNKAKDVKKLRF